MALVDVSGAFSGVVQSCTRIRTANGSRDSKGKYIEGSSVSTSFLASVQPASGEDLKRLKEGERTDEVLKLYAQIELTTVTDTHLADKVTIGDTLYETVNVKDYMTLGGYCKALVVKRGS